MGRYSAFTEFGNTSRNVPRARRTCIVDGCPSWGVKGRRPGGLRLCELHLRELEEERPSFEVLACYVRQCNETIVRKRGNRGVRHCPRCRQDLREGRDPADRFLPANVWTEPRPRRKKRHDEGDE